MLQKALTLKLALRFLLVGSVVTGFQWASSAVLKTSSNTIQEDTANLSEAQSMQCWLNPSWGSINSTDSSASQVCVGPNPKYPYSLASQLTCSQTRGSPRVVGADEDTGFTIGLLYYAEPSMLLRQLEVFNGYPPDLRAKISFVIIDDGSPDGLRAGNYIQKERYNFRMTLARVTKDIPWNIGGARNLVFHLAATTRVLLLDLDVLVPERTAYLLTNWSVSSTDPERYLAHKFNRVYPDGRKKMHPACTFIARKAYWMNGGCDESFVGSYGYTDPHFWHRFGLNSDKFDTVFHSSVYLEQFSVESCDENFVRNAELRSKCIQSQSDVQPLDRDIKPNSAKFRSKKESGCWSNSFLRFPWMIEMS